MIETFEDIDLERVKFDDLRVLLEGRRDFTDLRRINKVNKKSDKGHLAQSGSQKMPRIVFMINDDFDLFNVDQEVVYDSAIDLNDLTIA